MAANKAASVPPKSARLREKAAVLAERVENPVMGREFRARMRGARAYLINAAYTLAVMACVLVVYWGLASNSGDGPVNVKAAQVGRGIWTWGCLAQAVLVPLMVPAFTCGGITIEREREMLELLFLTHQSAFQICLGKWAAGVGLGVVLVFSSVPVLALCLLLGGVAPVEMVQCLAVLVTGVLAVGAFGLAVSTLAQKTTTSTVIVYVTVGFLLVGLPLLQYFLSQANSLSLSGSELGILAMLLAGVAIAFPPAVGCAAALYAVRAARTEKPAPRAWWMAVTGLAWCAILLALYIPGITDLLLQGQVLLMLHPVVVIVTIMNGSMTRVGSNLWLVCPLVYAGLTVWFMLIAITRVKRLRSA